MYVYARVCVYVCAYGIFMIAFSKDKLAWNDTAFLEWSEIRHCLTRNYSRLRCPITCAAVVRVDHDDRIRAVQEHISSREIRRYLF